MLDRLYGGLTINRNNKKSLNRYGVMKQSQQQSYLGSEEAGG